MTDLGDGISATVGSWTFGGDVAQTFDDHVSKSVPLYSVGHDLIAKLSDYFLSEGSTFYELGCSTGQLIRTVAERCSEKNVEFYGIDSEEPMIAKARELTPTDAIKYVHADITSFDFQPSDMVASYYTIQFIHPKVRQDLINAIYQSLTWGGAFVLFEKVRAPDARFQDILTGMYWDYKGDQGYSDAEILGKSRSLKGVLEPFSTAGNLGLLHRAGFTDIAPIFKHTCFEGLVAIK